MSGVKFMISDAGDFFTELSKKLKAAGGQPMTAEELKAMDAAAAKAKREKDAREQAERDAKDAENAKRAAEMEAQSRDVLERVGQLRRLADEAKAVAEATAASAALSLWAAESPRKYSQSPY